MHKHQTSYTTQSSAEKPVPSLAAAHTQINGCGDGGDGGGDAVGGRHVLLSMRGAMEAVNLHLPLWSSSEGRNTKKHVDTVTLSEESGQDLN